MAGSLPIVRVSAQALYPVTRRVEFLTDIAIGLNATEQRSKLRPPLTRFTFPYTMMNATELTNIRNFVDSQKGPFDSTWTVTLGATTYSNLTLDGNTFAAIEQAGSQTKYGFTLQAHQTANGSQTAGSAGGTFPTLSAGVRAQLPYTQIRRYSVLLNDNPVTGTRYAYTWFGGGLSGFPTGSLHAWTISYPVLSDADLSTLETFYRNQWGRWSSFTFVDPETSTNYTNSRFDDDAFEVQHQQPNISSVTIRIIETN